MDIIGKKYWYFIISGIIIIPGLVSFVLFGLNLSIDFTGGSVINFSYSNKIEESKFKDVFRKNGVIVHSVKYSGNDEISVRTNTIDQKKKTEVVDNLKKDFKGISEKGFDTVGPVIGNETKANALKAVLIASIAITFYIAYAFRKVSRPVASWKFGVCAVIALLHDVLVVVGVFSLLGHFLGVEVDSLFITALLTVMGFSVHDTIVVFDRIRENLRKNVSLPFERLVNDSILETLNRSLNTSLTVVLVLISLLLFGGEGIRWFIVALLVGIISGTYSSIFNASPMLVVWYEWRNRKRKV